MTAADAPVFECMFCPGRFGSLVDLLGHRNREHPAQVRPAAPKADPRELRENRTRARRF